MRISDWSSDVCSSDLIESAGLRLELRLGAHPAQDFLRIGQQREHRRGRRGYVRFAANDEGFLHRSPPELGRSEEHTSELQSLMRISYAVFCLKKKTTNKHMTHTK